MLHVGKRGVSKHGLQFGAVVLYSSNPQQTDDTSQ